MTDETSIHQPNQQPFDQGVELQIPYPEVVTEAQMQLAGNLVQLVADDDPTAVNAYLHDALQTETDTIPASERQAVFNFLADRQRFELREDMVSTGQTVLTKLEAGVSSAQRDLDTQRGPLKRGVQTMLDTHEQQVGRYFRNGVDT